jgi:yersiniabactin nonribosomal peptide synthetase
MEQLLNTLRALGINLKNIDGALHVEAPPGTMNEETKRSLLEHKSALLNLLKNDGEKESQYTTPLVHDHAHLFEKFALTELQQSYWLSRISQSNPEGIFDYFYIEFICQSIDMGRLHAALNRLIERHDMLRMTIDSKGKPQFIESPAPISIKIHSCETSNNTAANSLPHTLPAVIRVRNAMRSCIGFETQQWPLFNIQATKISSTEHVIHARLDHISMDGFSVVLFFNEWDALYRDPLVDLPTIKISYRDYIVRSKYLNATSPNVKSETYWSKRIAALPPAPALPFQSSKITNSIKNYLRKETRVEKSVWTKLKNLAQTQDITIFCLILVTFNEIISKWSASKHFTINITTGIRPPWHPDINRLIGTFSEMILLEVDKRDQKINFKDFAKQCQERLLEDQNHSGYSGVEVVRKWVKHHHAEPISLTSVVFGSGLGWPEQEKTLGKLDCFGKPIFASNRTSGALLDAFTYQADNELVLTWDYVDNAFEPGVIDTMFTAQVKLIERLADNPELWNTNDVVQLPSYLPVNPHHADTTYPAQHLHTALVKYAQENPGATAVVSAQRTLTFGDLLGEAVSIADYLSSHAIKPGEPVAVLMHKGWEQIVAVLGILLSGGAYVPIDAELPQSRRKELFRICNIRHVLVQKNQSLAAEIGIQTHEVIAGQALPYIKEFDRSALNPLDQVCYVIFTSGTTGTPKGVTITHESVWNTIAAINDIFDINEDDCVLGISSLSFDLSVYDIFGILGAGGKIVLPGKENDPQEWGQLMLDHHVTIWNSVPQFLQILVHSPQNNKRIFKKLKSVLLSGDFIPLDLPENFQKAGGSARIESLGGATEASIWSIHFPISKVEPNWLRIPYGKALPGQTMMVLDEKLQICPNFVTGIIYIGGKGLAKNYWGDERLTAQRFINHPVSGERIYNTGDLGLYDEKGNIIIQGRVDNQVKIRGYRVELGEIEHALKKHSEVNQAAVVNTILGGSNRNQIAAFVTKSTPNSTLSVDSLREHLNSMIAKYMIPDHIRILEQIPLTSNGKIDYKILKEMIDDALSVKVNTLPEDACEQTVFELWSKVLKINSFGVTDAFMDLGGDSVSTLILLGHLRDHFQSEISMADLSLSMTVRSLSNLIKDRIPGDDIRPSLENVLSPKDSEETTPAQSKSIKNDTQELSDIQIGFYMANQTYMEFHVRPHSYIEKDFEQLNIQEHIAAWNHIFKKRSSQITTVQSNGELTPIQSFSNLNSMVDDLRGMPIFNVRQKLSQTRSQMMRSELPIESWPWVDLRISIWTDEGRDRYRLHYNNNNFFIDAPFLNILIKEVAEFSIVEQNTITIPKLNSQAPAAYIKQLENSSQGISDKEYWLDRIASFPDAPPVPLKLNIDRRTRSNLNRREGFLSNRQWGKLKVFSKNFGVSSTSFLFGVYAKVLSFWSGCEHFLFANMMNRRLLLPSEMQGVLGNFASLYPLEVDHRNREIFSDFIAKIQAQNLSDASHMRFGGMHVMQAINQQKNTLGTATIPFVVSSAIFMDAFERPDFSCLETSQVLVDHQFWELKDGRMYYVWDVQEEFFPAGLIDDMWDAYGRLLEHLASDVENWKARDFDLLPQWQKDERRQWPVDEKRLPHERLGDLLIKANAQYAQAEAVVSGGESPSQQGARRLDHAGLARGAAAVQQALLQSGVKAGDRVALVMERGVHSLMAVHGAMLAGAAYVPMDKGLPQQRMRQIVQDCGAKAVLCMRATADQFGQSVKAIAVDALPDWDGDLASLRVPDEVEHNSLAYIIYTSGSTGVPKGVMINHRGAMNTVRAVNRRFGVRSSDRILGVSSLGFDLSVYDMFGAADAGACLVYPDPEQTLNPAHWLELLNKEGITIWNSAPALAVLMCEAAELRGARLPELRLVMLSGDWIPLDLPQRIKRIAANARVVSLGGATEASIWSIWHTVDELDPAWRSIPYGRAMDNQHWYVLNDRLQDSPVWVEGDLYIGGVGLAMGYWGDAKKTEAAFIMRDGERLYRTGDRGRFVPGGLIEFLGRRDAQVKVQGHRIELGEVEAALVAHPAVSAAVAVVQHRAALATDDAAPGPDAAQSAELAAHVVLHAGQKLEAAELTTFLAARLPAYMVPRLLGFLSALPLSPNGKLDRKALPILGSDAALVAAKVARPPGDEIETQLLALWSQVLEREINTVGPDFFELGGQSFAAVRLVGMIKEAFGTRLSLADVWQNRDVESLAALVRSSSAHVETPILRCLADQYAGAAPLVMIHPAGGQILAYRHLAALLRRPVWAIEAPSDAQATVLGLHTVEAIAAHYVSLLKEAAFQADFWVGGWSSGGPVAFEMAAQLHRAGRAVRGVLMVDSPAPAAHWGDQIHRRTLLSWFAEDLGLDAAAMAVVNRLSVDGLDHTAQLTALQAALVPIHAGLPVGVQELVPVYQTFERMVRATRTYRPPMIDLPVLLLRALDGQVSEFGGHPAQGEPTWGWQAHGKPGAMQAVWVKGTHHTVLLETYVAACAQAIEAWTVANT